MGLQPMALIASFFSLALVALAGTSPQLSLIALPSSGTAEPVLDDGTKHRKLLLHHDKNKSTGTGMMESTRILGEKCRKSDIGISQGPTAPLPSGIPAYTVEIVNKCSTDCDISAIHLTCGWFSSARLINPKVFKRLRYNDCLVNDGKPLLNGAIISFQYANTFPYPLSVASVACDDGTTPSSMGTSLDQI